MRLLIAFLLFFSVLFSAPGGSGQMRDGLPLFNDDLDQDSLRRAIHRSLEFLAKLPPDRSVGEQPRKITAAEVKESLIAFLNLLDLWDQPDKLNEEIRSRFELYPMSDAAEGEALFTGYYQPLIEGRLTETAEYRYPIYRRPDDLVEVEPGSILPELRGEKVVGRLEENRLVPYPSRYEIDALGRLKGKGYEIAWVKDPVELFFLHIQGSGIMRLEDGRQLQLNYAASNGRPYKSIGRLLVDGGKISEEEVSMQRLRRYLMEHPEERDAVFAQNESYVFFRLVTNGPLGSLEVPLTPGRSIATDSRLFPKGALAFVVSQKPILGVDGNLTGWQPFSRFVLNQDTGSAIRGPKRVDLYFGSGHEAGLAAGFMKSNGMIYFLIQKKGTGR
ncbi:MAG: MltA domain-containing protein [Deltaproteobacteria bacterium]|nr:MltA domain-containing protein [Deltaproteobacteria bacterium]